MANTNGTTWDEGSPVISDARRSGALEIQSLRKAVKVRMDKEHIALAGSSAGGGHLLGSAVTYYQASAPTTKPDGVTPLDTADKGRIWIDSDTLYAQVWTGAAWADILSPVVPSLDHFYQGSNTSPPTLPLTVSGLSAGTWMAFVLVTLLDGTAAFTVGITAQSQSRTYVMDNCVGGTVPVLLPLMSLTVTGAGTLSLSALSNVKRLIAMTGFRIA